jgi:hypothetical protein
MGKGKVGEVGGWAYGFLRVVVGSLKLNKNS